MSSAAAIRTEELSTDLIANVCGDALRADVGDERHAEKKIANACGCGLRTARNWLDRQNGPDDLYAFRLIRSKHFPHFTAAWLRLAGVDTGVDPRLAHAMNAAFEAFSQFGGRGGAHSDKSMVNRLDEPEGWRG